MYAPPGLSEELQFFNESSVLQVRDPKTWGHNGKVAWCCVCRRTATDDHLESEHHKRLVDWYWMPKNPIKECVLWVCHDSAGAKTKCGSVPEHFKKLVKESPDWQRAIRAAEAGSGSSSYTNVAGAQGFEMIGNDSNDVHEQIRSLQARVYTLEADLRSLQAPLLRGEFREWLEQRSLQNLEGGKGEGIDDVPSKGNGKDNGGVTGGGTGNAEKQHTQI